MAILDLVSNARIPLISLALSYQIVTDPSGSQRKWIFKTPASDSASVEKIYAFFNRRGIQKIALMTVSNGYGDSGRSELLRLAPNFGIEVAADERFGDEDVDMTAQLTKIKGSPAQAIVVWATQKAPAIIARNHRTLGLTQLLVQSQGVATKTFIELCGDAADGQVLPGGRLIVAEQLPDTDPQKKILLAYKHRFEARYGPVSVFGGHAYDALMLLTMAMTRAGSDDPALVRDALEEIKGFVGIDGVFNLSPADHCGLYRDAFIMLKIENGDWKIVE
jgi:branched-chain amino acid transport system substrate-binding protein